MSGHNFLSKYRELIKAEKEVNKNKKLIFEKMNYNSNFDNNFYSIKNKYENIIISKKRKLKERLLISEI